MSRYCVTMILLLSITGHLNAGERKSKIILSYVVEPDGLRSADLSFIKQLQKVIKLDEDWQWNEILPDSTDMPTFEGFLLIPERDRRANPGGLMRGLQALLDQYVYDGSFISYCHRSDAGYFKFCEMSYYDRAQGRIIARATKNFRVPISDVSHWAKPLYYKMSYGVGRYRRLREEQILKAGLQESQQKSVPDMTLGRVSLERRLLPLHTDQNTHMGFNILGLGFFRQSLDLSYGFMLNAGHPNDKDLRDSAWQLWGVGVSSGWLASLNNSLGIGLGLGLGIDLLNSKSQLSNMLWLSYMKLAAGVSYQGSHPLGWGVEFGKHINFNDQQKTTDYFIKPPSWTVLGLTSFSIYLQYRLP